MITPSEISEHTKLPCSATAIVKHSLTSFSSSAPRKKKENEFFSHVKAKTGTSLLGVAKVARKTL